MLSVFRLESTTRVNSYKTLRWIIFALCWSKQWVFYHNTKSVSYLNKRALILTCNGYAIKQKLRVPLVFGMFFFKKELVHIPFAKNELNPRSRLEWKKTIFRSTRDCKHTATKTRLFSCVPTIVPDRAHLIVRCRLCYCCQWLCGGRILTTSYNDLFGCISELQFLVERSVVKAYF